MHTCIQTCNNCDTVQCRQLLFHLLLKTYEKKSKLQLAGKICVSFIHSSLWSIPTDQYQSLSNNPHWLPTRKHGHLCLLEHMTPPLLWWASGRNCIFLFLYFSIFPCIQVQKKICIHSRQIQWTVVMELHLYFWLKCLVIVTCYSKIKKNGKREFLFLHN